MRKYNVLFIALCFVSAAVSAQVKPSGNKGGFMIRGGVNLANISVTDNGRVDEANGLTSFHAGIGVDIPLSSGLSLQPALLLSGKGAKTQFGQPTDATYWRATSNPLYVELPLNLVGKIPLSEYTRLYIGAGGYAAAGVSGKNEREGKILGSTFRSESDIIFSDDDPTTSAEENAGYGKLKRFDYGLNAVAGLDFNKFSIGANYGHGLAKINSNTNNNANDEGKHRVFSIALGIKL